MSQVQLRINGRGNAWPVFLGQDHPFYNRKKYEDLANASCSILKRNHKEKNEIEWELLIDAGHGTVQYFLQNHNRIPEAIFITHPHIDHFLGIDWIIQSYSKIYQKPYPVYATILAWKKILVAFPQLEPLVDFNELKPCKSTIVDQVPGVQITAYPVYHGQSAEGAAMFLFEVEGKKVLFTGDLLCPLLKEEDLNKLSSVDLLITDANNRFPYPECNHWSIISETKGGKPNYLEKFIHNHSIGLLLTPHLKAYAPISYSNCFNFFLENNFTLHHFIFDSLSFVKQTKPKQVVFMHYSGNEDEKYYQESILNHSELQSWIKNIIRNHSIDTTVTVPGTGQYIDI
ncbi:MAG: MBL fold metallo-hydrolase [Bacteroidota bacterium]